MNRRTIYGWLAGTAVLAIGAACVTIVEVWPPFGIGLQIEIQQRALLYHTDHVAVLAACRQFMRDQRLPKFGMSFSGSDPQLPATIRHLHANSVFASNESMSIDFGGGFIDGYGFTAYAPGSYLEKQEGDIRILPGLWYFGGQNGTSAR